MPDIVTSFQLDVDIVNEHVGRANILVQRLNVVAQPRLCFGEADPSLAKSGVDLHGITKFNQRFRVFLPLAESVAALLS